MYGMAPPGINLSSLYTCMGKWADLLNGAHCITTDPTPVNVETSTFCPHDSDIDNGVTIGLLVGGIKCCSPK